MKGIVQRAVHMEIEDLLWNIDSLNAALPETRVLNYARRYVTLVLKCGVIFAYSRDKGIICPKGPTKEHYQILEEPLPDYILFASVHH